MTRLTLRIGRLVLPELAPVERRRVVAAFEAEIGRRLQGATLDAGQKTTVRTVTGLGPFSLPSGFTPEERGARLAQSVLARLAAHEGSGLDLQNET